MFAWVGRLLGRAAGEAEPPPAEASEVVAGFADRTREVMRLANREARRFRHEYVGTEHILLGLLQLGDGVAAEVLRQCNITVRAIREEVERIIPHGPGGMPAPPPPLPLTPYAKSVIRWAREEARFLGHHLVDTEHLLMGLLHELECVAAGVLNDCGLTVDRARRELLRLSPPPAGPGDIPEL